MCLYSVIISLFFLIVPALKETEPVFKHLICFQIYISFVPYC